MLKKYAFFAVTAIIALIFFSVNIYDTVIAPKQPALEQIKEDYRKVMTRCDNLTLSYDCKPRLKEFGETLTNKDEILAEFLKVSGSLMGMIACVLGTGLIEKSDE